METVRIERMTQFNIPDVVQLHTIAFPNFFLTSLGLNFLKEMYMGYLIVDPEKSCSLVAIDVNNEKVVGFVCGVLNSKSFYKSFLKKRWFTLGKEITLVSLQKPSIAIYILNNIKMRIFGKKGISIKGAELSSLAVDTTYQGKSIGKQLVNHFLEEMKKRGINSVYLTTDKDKNESVNSFYNKNGWQLEQEYSLSNGRVMNLYRYYLDNFK